MTTTELLVATVKRLPEPLVLELLDFAEYLESKYNTQEDEDYAKAKQRALSMMESGFDLGGKGITDRDALHER
jgi:hypothetical protein